MNSRRAVFDALAPAKSTANTGDEPCTQFAFGVRVELEIIFEVAVVGRQNFIRRQYGNDNNRSSYDEDSDSTLTATLTTGWAYSFGSPKD